jgi:TPR repeat protein
MQLLVKTVLFLFLSIVLALLFSNWLGPWFMDWKQSQTSVVSVNALQAFETGQQYELEANYSQAAHWYQKAAQQGLAQAQMKLAHLYQNGQGITQNFAQTGQWLTKAARQGLVDAQCELADMYYTGKGVIQNLPQAAHWYQKAALQGQVDAQFKLGIMYQKGKGIPQNFAQAAKWFKQAAQQDHREAKRQLQLLQMKVYKLFRNKKFQATYELASLFEIPKLQKIAHQAKQQMTAILSKLQDLYAKGDYAEVIQQGTPKIKHGQDIYDLVFKAKQVQIARKQVIQLFKENKLQQAIEVASPHEVPELQKLVTHAQRQINLTLTKLQHLYRQGHYEAVVHQGQTKIMMSNEIKQLVEAAQVKAKNFKPHHIQVASQVTFKKEPIKLQPLENFAIAVFGDSLADGIWGGIHRELRQDKRFTVHRATVTASGLAINDWQNNIKELLLEHQIDIAIIVMGTNDGRVLIQKRKRFAYKSKEWEIAYVQRVKDLMGLLETHQISTYWIGLPAVRRHYMKEQITLLNRIYQENAALFSMIRFLPTWHLTVNEQGQYAAYGLDKTGRKRLLRANDGVHFTIPGYDKLAHYILTHIHEDWPFIYSTDLPISFLFDSNPTAKEPLLGSSSIPFN